MGSAKNSFSGGSLFRAAVNPYKHSQSDESFFNVLDGGGSGGKKGGQAPTPPDYVGAAREQGQQNIALAQTNARLGNPDMKTPLGERKVSFSGGDEQWNPNEYLRLNPDVAQAGVHPRQHWEQYGRFENRQGGVVRNPESVSIEESLNPQAQQIFDTFQNTAQRGVGRVQEAFSRPFSFGGADELQNKAEQSYLSRMEPQFQRNQDSLKSRLAAQGIDPYGEAASKEHERLGFQENDARSQAILKAFGMRPQMLQEELAIRNQPLNETMALLSGSQVQMPQFQNYTGATAQPAPHFEGVQNQGLAEMGLYNIGQQRGASTQAGLFGLGAAALPYIMSAFSDRRLKSNIERVGTHHLGIGVYEYDIFGKRERGVMAHEVLTVKPEAVGEKDGFMTVDYGMLQ